MLAALCTASTSGPHPRAARAAGPGTKPPVSYFEWAQNLQHFSWDEHEVNDRLGKRIRRAYRTVEERASARHVSLRVAAYELGIERIIEAGRLRGHRGYT